MHNLSVTNTFFQQSDAGKTLWMHPRSRHWHLLDYIIVRQRRRCQADMFTTCVNLLVRPLHDSLQLASQRRHKSKPVKKLRIQALHHPDAQRNIETRLDEELNKVAEADTAAVEWTQLKLHIKLQWTPLVLERVCTVTGLMKLMPRPSQCSIIYT